MCTHSLTVCARAHAARPSTAKHTAPLCCPILDDSIRHHFYYYDWSCVFIFYCFFVLLCEKVGAVAVEALHSLTLLDTFGCCCCGRALPLSLSTSFSLARVTFEESDKKSGGAGGVQRVESPLFGDHLEAHTLHSVTTQRLIDSLCSEFCCCCDMFCATKQTHSLPLEH